MFAAIDSNSSSSEPESSSDSEDERQAVRKQRKVQMGEKSARDAGVAGGRQKLGRGGAVAQGAAATSQEYGLNPDATSFTPVSRGRARGRRKFGGARGGHERVRGRDELGKKGRGRESGGGGGGKEEVRAGERIPSAAEPPLVVMLVGPPGSGKSTFSARLSEYFTIINQDTLGSRRACEHEMRLALAKRQPVVIDRCNFDPKQRGHFLAIARDFRVPQGRICALQLMVSIDECVKRVSKRTGHPTLQPGPKSEGVVRRFAHLMQPPRLSEGFGHVIGVNAGDDVMAAEFVAWTTGCTTG